MSRSSPVVGASSTTATRVPSPIPNAPKLPPLSRPLCPYPEIAVYDGKGNPASEASFNCKLVVNLTGPAKKS